MLGRGAYGRKDAVEIDVDDPVPALITVALERALRIALSLRSDPRADEPRSRVDTSVSTHDIQTPVFPGGFIDRGVERLVIRNVDGFSAYIQPSFAEPLRLVLDTLRM